MFWECLVGPQLYRRYKSPIEPGRIYQANFLEHYSQKTLSAFHFSFYLVGYLSPILIPYLWRRGWFSQTPEGRFWTLAAVAGLAYGGAVFFRAVGRLANKDYLNFLSVLQEANQTQGWSLIGKYSQTGGVSNKNLTLLRLYDFDFTYWPIDYEWKWEVKGQPIRKRKTLASLEIDESDTSSSHKLANQGKTLWQHAKSGLCALAAHSFGKRLLYPGSMWIFQFALGPILDQGRVKVCLKSILSMIDRLKI